MLLFILLNYNMVSDELLLPHMKKIDGMLNDNRKRLLLNLHLDQPFKVFRLGDLLIKLIVAFVVPSILGNI